MLTLLLFEASHDRFQLGEKRTKRNEEIPMVVIDLLNAGNERKLKEKSD
jgi:hypothetical protein